jgi:hypothetical protein
MGENAHKVNTKWLQAKLNFIHLKQMRGGGRFQKCLRGQTQFHQYSIIKKNPSIRKEKHGREHQTLAQTFKKSK